MSRREHRSRSKSHRRLRPGDVFAIPLGDGTHGFGQLCWEANDCAFFDLRCEPVPAIADILCHSVLFRVPIDQSVLKSGRWPAIGNVPLTGDLAEPASYRNQPVGSDHLYLYRAGEFREATVEEVRDLELLSVWCEEHIVERLLDHFAGRLNRTVEYFKTMRVSGPDGQDIGSR